MFFRDRRRRRRSISRSPSRSPRRKSKWVFGLVWKMFPIFEFVDLLLNVQMYSREKFNLLFLIFFFFFLVIFLCRIKAIVIYLKILVMFAYFYLWSEAKYQKLSKSSNICLHWPSMSGLELENSSTWDWKLELIELCKSWYISDISCVFGLLLM